MSGKRPRRRVSSAGQFDLYPADSSQGWRVIRKTTFGDGEQQVTLGKWRRVYDKDDVHVGYQVKETFESEHELASGSTSIAIVEFEMKLNAGLSGESRTEHMYESDRIVRKSELGRGLPPEDAIERAKKKVKLWPKPASRLNKKGKPKYGDKAVRVYPKG